MLAINFDPNDLTNDVVTFKRNETTYILKYFIAIEEAINPEQLCLVLLEVK